VSQGLWNTRGLQISLRCAPQAGYAHCLLFDAMAGCHIGGAGIARDVMVIAQHHYKRGAQI